MTAEILVFIMGKDLIGRTIRGQVHRLKYEDVQVLRLFPDRSSPEIVMQVKRSNGSEIGIFDYEKVTPIIDTKLMKDLV